MVTRPYFRSLRGKITNRFLAIGILPILAVGAIAWFSLNLLIADISQQLQKSHSVLLDKVVGTTLTSISKNAVQQLDIFMLERISNVIVWASAPVVIDAAKMAAIVHHNNGLSNLNINAIEAKFQNRKSLNVSPEATEYIINQISKSPHFGEIFFTDSNGLNAALTNPTSDFVQSDEDWWITAWEKGISVGEVEFDNSAGIWSVDISVRIDDSNGSGVGVMKAVLGVSLIQEVANAWVAEIPGGKVTAVNRSGLLLAETASQHAQNRIMNESINLRKQADSEMQQVFSNQTGGRMARQTAPHDLSPMQQVFSNQARWGYIIGEEQVLGYAKSAGSEFYHAAIPGFEGFDWQIIMEQPIDIALAPIQGLSSIQDGLINSQRQMLIVLVSVGIIICLLALFLARVLSNGITVPVLQLRELAEAVSKGDIHKPIRVTSDDEIRDLAVSFDRLRTSISIILKRYQELQNKSS